MVPAATKSVKQKSINNMETQKFYRTKYTVWYGDPYEREVEVMASTQREALDLSIAKIDRLEPEADEYIIHGLPELIKEVL